MFHALFVCFLVLKNKLSQFLFILCVLYYLCLNWVFCFRFIKEIGFCNNILYDNSNLNKGKEEIKRL